MPAAVAGGQGCAWYKQLSLGAERMRRRVSSGCDLPAERPTPCVCVCPEPIEGTGLESYLPTPSGQSLMRQPSRAFEFAEVMEQGIAPGASSEFIKPPEGQTGKERRLVVHCDPNRQCYVLTTEADEPLLLARPRKQAASRRGRFRRTNSGNDAINNGASPVFAPGGFDIFVTHDGEPPIALGPAFSLTPLAAGGFHWSLASARCEECQSNGRRTCGVRELARITHYSETVGEGQAYCMDVELPRLGDDGHQDVWCTQCGDCTVEDRRTDLTSRRPRWSAKSRSLTMDFRGRCSLASASNFQLVMPEKERGKSPRLLFGKVAENRFVLDYAKPLGAVQAFAAALTAADQWVA